MPKRKCDLELNTWVLVRPKKRQWAHASPALVSHVPKCDDGKDDSRMITVLFPNMLVMQHGWEGQPYWEENVSAADVRPYEGAPRQHLTDQLLRAIHGANSKVKHVEERRIRKPLGQKPMSSGDETSLLNLAFGAIPHFGGLLAEYLWSERRTTKTSLETVSSSDCLGRSLLYCAKDERTLTFSVPICEPVMFVLMRTSRTICRKVIAGIKARSRIECDSDVSLRFMSIISAVTQAAFPGMWKKTRLLCARPTTEDDLKRMDASLQNVLAVEQARRQSQRAHLAEKTLDEDEADEQKYMWNNFASSSAGRVHSVANLLVKAFSQSYKRDAYIIGLPRLEFEARVSKELGCGAKELNCALWDLQCGHKLHIVGDLIFPL